MTKDTPKKNFNSKFIILGFQHVLAMFGATVLVPYLTGLNPSIAILGAGIGTLIFHSVTKKIVPVFLGSSFAFIGAISLTLQSQGIGYVKAGIIGAGIVYLMISLLVYLFGVKRVKSFFPPIVTGPIIMVIGLRLSPIALSMSGYDPALGVFEPSSVLIASVVVVTMIVISIFMRGFFKMVPILISIIVGYFLAAILGLVDFTIVNSANWFGLTPEAFTHLRTLPKFNWSSLLAIAPIAIVVFIEHIGDITTNGAVVGKDFFKNPGIHRTVLGDGLATIAAGLIGAPANTTYSENTGVLAVTKVYNPVILRFAAVFAIIIAFIGKFGALIQSIPVAVMGGVSIILFGMIASVGIRTLIDAQLDFSKSRNLLISALIVVTGISINEVYISASLSVSGLVIAAFLGILLNKILPDKIVKN